MIFRSTGEPLKFQFLPWDKIWFRIKAGGQKERIGMRSPQGRDKAKNDTREAHLRQGRKHGTRNRFPEEHISWFPCAKHAKKSKQATEISSWS